MVGDDQRFQRLVSIRRRLEIQKLFGLAVDLAVPPVITGDFLNLHASRKPSFQNRPCQFLRRFLAGGGRHDHAGLAHRKLAFIFGIAERPPIRR